MNMKWVEVKTVKVWGSEDGDSSGKTETLHTFKVDEDCEDLAKECEKKLQEKNIQYHRVSSIKFV